MTGFTVTSGPSGWSSTFTAVDRHVVQVIKVPTMAHLILSLEAPDERNLILAMLTEEQAAHIRDRINDYLDGAVPGMAIDVGSEAG